MKNTCSKATTLMDAAVKGAASSMPTIRVLSNVLIEELEKIHGGGWRFKYDSEGEFLIIARKPDHRRAA